MPLRGRRGTGDQNMKPPETMNVKGPEVRNTQVLKTTVTKDPELKNTKASNMKPSQVNKMGPEVKGIAKGPEGKNWKPHEVKIIKPLDSKQTLEAVKHMNLPETKLQTKHHHGKGLLMGTAKSQERPMVRMRVPEPRRPSALELANRGKSSQMLMATPIRIAMMESNNNNNNRLPFVPGAMVRSATTLEAEDLIHRSRSKRSSDHGTRGIVRPGSLIEQTETEKKRSSDPILPGNAPTTGALSIRTLLDSGLESLGFRRLGAGRIKKTSAADTSTPNVTPSLKRSVQATSGQKATPAKGAKKIDTPEKDASTSIDSSTTSVNCNASRPDTRRKKSTRRRGFFGNTSQCAAPVNDSSSDEEKVG